MVKFSLSKITLEPMLRSMAYISEQLSTPANKVAVINLKVCVFLYDCLTFKNYICLHCMSQVPVLKRKSNL